jgi:hypothetical protein
MSCYMDRENIQDYVQGSIRIKVKVTDQADDPFPD